jgi:hypothetical protein
VLIYSVLFSILLFLAFRYTKSLNMREMNPWIVPSAFLLKILVGSFFLYVYSIHYGRGALSADAGAFMRESKMVFEVFFKSPLDYLKLVSGIGETDELIHKYLPHTFHWDAGDLTIINDSKNVLRVHSLIHFFSFGNPFIHMLVMSFLSLLATIHLYKSIRSYSNLKSYLLFSILFLVPSTLFWTSGILKEPMLFLGIALFVRGVLDPTMGKRKYYFIPAGLILMLLFKPYVLACILPALGFHFIYRYFGGESILKSLAISSALLAITVLVFPKTEETFTHYISRKQFDFDNVGKGGIHVLGDTCFYYFKPEQIDLLDFKGNLVTLKSATDAYVIYFGSIQSPIPIHLQATGETWQVAYKSVGCLSYIEPKLIENSTSQLIKNIPESLANSVLRPYPGDPGSWLKIPAMFEVWIIFFVFLICITYRRKLNGAEKGLIGALFIFALSLYLLIGWTTPVIGAIARYRFPAQLAVVFIGLILIDSKKIFKNA